MVEDCKKLLNTIKNLKPYLVEFEENRSIKIKKYLDDCIIEGDKCYLVIVTTYDKCKFSTNDRV